MDTITSNLLKRTDWVQMHPKNPERRLDNDDQIRAVLVRVFGNMNPGGPLSNPKFDRQAFLRDLAEVSDLRGFSSELGQLKSAQAQVRGYVAEIQAAAADRRAGKVVEDLDLHVEVNRTGTKIEKTDIDLISDGTLYQLKVGRSPEAIDKAAGKLGEWTENAIAVARSQGKKKIGFRFDEEAMKRYDHEIFQKRLAELKKQNPDIEFLPAEKITPPEIP